MTEYKELQLFISFKNANKNIIKKYFTSVIILLVNNNGRSESMTN
jgi:hypothetical protein